MRKNSIKSNYFYNLMYQILAIVIPVVTIPYVSRILGPDGVGAYNYTSSIAAVFVLVANLGSSAYAQREIAFCQDDVLNRSKVFFEILIIRIITAIIITPVYLVVCNLSGSNRPLLIVQYLYIIATAIDISWLFQGLEEFKKTALRNITVKLFTLVSIFLFIKKEDDVFLYCLIMSFSMLCSSSILWAFLRGIVVKVRFSELTISHRIKPILTLFLPVAAIHVYTSVDKILLGYLSTQTEVGYYSQSEKIVKLVMTVITALGAVMLPRIASLLKSDKYDEVRRKVYQSINFVFFIGSPMMMGLIGIAPEFIPLFLGDKYANSILLLQMLAPLTIIIGLSSVTGQAVLIPLNKQNIYTISIIIGACLNLIGNCILIPLFQSRGAAFSTLLAELTVGLIQLCTVMVSLDMRLLHIVKCVYKEAFASLSIILISLIIRHYCFDSLQVLILTIFASIITYFSILFLTKDGIIYYIIKFNKKAEEI